MVLMDEGQQRWYCYKDDQLYYADIGYTYTWDTKQYGGSGSYHAVGPVEAGHITFIDRPLQQTGKDSSKGTGALTAFVLVFAAVFGLMFFLLAGTHAFCINYGYFYVCFHFLIACGVAFVIASAALLMFGQLRHT